MIGNQLNRREFIGALSAAGIALALPTRGAAASAKPLAAYKHRVQFGCWINDMRNEVLPRTNWPAMTLDDKTERDIIDTLTLGHENGYNQLDVWGLFASSAYPIDIRSAFRDAERRPRALRILAAARERQIKIIYGTGVYSWGFDQIIAHDPAVRGSNPHVMCASSDASLEWQKKLIDAIVEELNVDGFSSRVRRPGAMHV
jgi:hypothetical protein